MKPWPHDSLTIAVPIAHQAMLDPNRPVLAVTCRDCRQRCLVRMITLIKAVEHPQRNDRAIEFLCTQCVREYDPKTVDVLLVMRPECHG